MSTFGTDLGSVIRLDFNKFNTFSFRFVLDETLQLKETPITNPIIHSLSSSDFSNTFKIFHYNFVSIESGNNILTNFMIYPSHKTFLFSRDFFKQSLGTSCAFSLEFTSQKPEFSFNLFNLRRFEELPVRSDSEIINSQVHTENSVRTRTNGAFLGECEQEETFTFGINPQKTFINFPTEIIFETRRNSERNFNSSFDCRYTQDVILERATSWRVVSDRTEFDNGLSFSFLNNPTGLFNTRNSKLRRHSHFFQSQINKRMQFNIIINSLTPSSIYTKLECFFINFNSSDYFISCFNLNLDCCSGSHKYYKDSKYINLTKLKNEEVFLLPTLKGLGIRKTRFI